MSLRITAVVLAVTVISYFHIVHTLTQETQDKLHKYIAERGAKESAIFELAADNLQVLKTNFLNDYRSMTAPTDAEFAALYQTLPDGTTRLRPEAFDGLRRADGTMSRYITGFAGIKPERVKADLDLRKRLVLAWRLLDRFGPAWVNRFANVYVHSPENFNIVYWPGLRWGLNAEPGLDMTVEEWMTIATAKNDPRRGVVWTGLYFDPTANEWMVSAENPVDENGRHLATLGHDILLNALFKRVFDDHLAGAKNFIIRPDGRLVAHPDKVKELEAAKGVLDIRTLDDPELSSMYEQLSVAMKGATEAGVLVDDEKNSAFLAATRLQGPGWWFVTVYPKSLLTSIAKVTAEFILGLSVIALIIELTALYLVLRKKVVAPLKVFVDASRVVAAGDYHQVASGALALPEDRRDEIGVLARTFRVMSQHAEDNREDLERKVVARTQQLALAIDDARKANEAKSSFLARMSHEIRTPMNAVMGMSRLALKTDLTARQRDYVEKIFTSAESLLRILNDILDFSKIEAGRLSLEQVNFHLVDVLKSVSGVVTLKAHSKGLELLFEIAPDVPRYLVGDPLRLGQIIINLTTNAVKFTENGEVVLRVSCESSDDASAVLRFSIHDSGIGVAADRLDALFEPFTQEDDSITRKYGGTGLGLAICKQLVEMMGGTLSASSELGHGSEFTFTAKLGLDASIDSDRQRSPIIDGLKGTRALVVDDNAMARSVLTGLLAQMGMRTDSASSGEQGLAMLRSAQAASNPYSLMLLDCNMPGLDGMETARLIQQDPATAAPTSIMMVTAYSHENLAAEAAEVGIRQVLTKPVNESTLHDSVVEALLGSEAAIARRQELAKQVSKPIELLRQRGAKILLAEDSALNRQVAQEFLAEVGMDVDVAVNGLEAISMVEAHTYDLVLMDIQMPELDGISATRTLRADQRYANLPIIAMTAHAMTGDRELSLQAGMNDHITKPIDPDQLYATLARWLPRRRTTDPQATTAIDPTAASELAILAPLAAQGIDVDSGLARYLNRKSFYISVLRGFVSEYGSAVHKLKELHAAGAREEIFRLAHTLKANAEGIGASALAEAARSVEDTARTQLPDGNAITMLTSALAHALNALETITPEYAAAVETPAVPVDVAAGLERLVQRLDEDDAVSLDMARQLQRAVRNSPQADAVDELVQLIEDLEYAEASSSARALLRDLVDA